MKQYEIEKVKEELAFIIDRGLEESSKKRCAELFDCKREPKEVFEEVLSYDCELARFRERLFDYIDEHCDEIINYRKSLE